MDGVARQMLADFDTNSLLQHSGAKGAVREEAVRAFLSKYLPRTVDVAGSGELMATSGAVSNQCDVLVLDAGAPPFWSDSTYRIAPIESCYAMVEVKSNLTSDELKKAWDAANGVKMLPRAAYRNRPSISDGGVTLHDNRSARSLPPQVQLFAFTSVSMGVIGKQMHDLAQRDSDPALGVDSVYILDKGVVSWVNPGAGSVGHRTASSEIGAWESEPGRVLLWMLVHMQQRIGRSTSSDLQFDLSRYIPESLGTLYGWWPEPPAGLIGQLRSL